MGLGLPWQLLSAPVLLGTSCDRSNHTLPLALCCASNPPHAMHAVVCLTGTQCQPVLGLPSHPPARPLLQPTTASSKACLQ